MAGTIICDYIRTDANKLSLNVGNTTFATINAMGLLSNTGVQIINQNGQINAASISAASITNAQLVDSIITRGKIGYAGALLQTGYAYRATEFTTTSTTPTAITGLSVTLTPTSSNTLFIIEGVVNIRRNSVNYVDLRINGTLQNANGRPAGNMGASGVTSETNDKHTQQAYAHYYVNSGTAPLTFDLCLSLESGTGTGTAEIWSYGQNLLVVREYTR